jgi:hypothetical protein
MRKRIEAFFYGRRWRADEHAWRVWQNLAPRVPGSLSDLEWGKPVAGRVFRVYQRAQRGTKAVVHFGDSVGLQDTWWEAMRPAPNQWVVVRTHLWFPPGTHSGSHVVWIDGWESWAAGDVYLRAMRHQRRVEKEGHGASPPGLKGGSDPAPALSQGQPLFHTDALAVESDEDAVMASALEIAADLGGKVSGPSEVGGGRLVTIWPAEPVPAFVSVTARAFAPGKVWVRVAAQCVAASWLDVGDDVKAGLESRLGSLADVLPPPRDRDYDREETRRLEGEIQHLLEAMAVAQPSSWGSLTAQIYERELLLQHLTELGA